MIKKWDRQVDLIGGPIMKNLFIFMLPILVSYIFQQLYNAVDTAIVGHFLGEQSLAAVGANVAIFDLMVMFAQALGNGLCIVVSRAYGAGDEGRMRKSVAGSLAIGAECDCPGIPGRGLYHCVRQYRAFRVVLVLCQSELELVVFRPVAACEHFLCSKTDLTRGISDCISL